MTHMIIDRAYSSSCEPILSMPMASNEDLNHEIVAEGQKTRDITENLDDTPLRITLRIIDTLNCQKSHICG